MKRQGRSLLLATLLCVLSLPVNVTVARTLLPETLVHGSWLASQPFPWFPLQPGLQPLVGSACALGALVNESRNWRDLLTRVLPSQLPLSLRRRLLQQVVVLMWCLNAELRGFDREATVLAPTSPCARSEAWIQKSMRSTFASANGKGAVQAASGRLARQR